MTRISLKDQAVQKRETAKISSLPTPNLTLIDLFNESIHESLKSTSWGVDPYSSRIEWWCCLAPQSRKIYAEFMT